MHCEWWQVAGILTGDAALVGQSLDSDVIIEPVRGPLIPGFAAVKAAAKAAGMPLSLFGFIIHVCSLAMWQPNFALPCRVSKALGMYVKIFLTTSWWCRQSVNCCMCNVAWEDYWEIAAKRIWNDKANLDIMWFGNVHDMYTSMALIDAMPFDAYYVLHGITCTECNARSKEVFHVRVLLQVLLGALSVEQAPHVWLWWITQSWGRQWQKLWSKLLNKKANLKLIQPGLCA